MTETRGLLKLKSFEQDRTVIRVEELAEELRTTKLDNQCLTEKVDLMRKEYAVCQFFISTIIQMCVSLQNFSQ